MVAKQRIFVAPKSAYASLIAASHYTVKRPEGYLDNYYYYTCLTSHTYIYLLHIYIFGSFDFLIYYIYLYHFRW